MENMYVVIWVAKNKDRSGIGQRHFNREQAEALANDLNENYPGFLHRAMSLREEDAALAIEELRAEVSATPNGRAMPEFASLQASRAEAALIIDPNTPPAVVARLDHSMPLHPVLFG